MCGNALHQNNFFSCYKAEWKRISFTSEYTEIKKNISTARLILWLGFVADHLRFIILTVLCLICSVVWESEYRLHLVTHLVYYTLKC